MIQKISKEMFNSIDNCERSRIYRKLACLYYLIERKDLYEIFMNCASLEVPVNGWFHMIKALTVFIETRDLQKVVKEIHISLRIFTRDN